MPSDNALFNCGQDHEINYVASLYLEQQKVRELLKEKCADGVISHWTHKKLYTWLESQGFTKIK
ncbi:MAG: hypothetical protein KH208_06580 [Desulfovibrio sp.]|uniref:hypothetical protein n=1 Tax=Desulfovibrio sp. TaxID=885 RepID=UPI0025BE47F8|nr:hypothetical protein [Desulfovibrio sp.]MBS6829524.1 hypothetical protein [Desulfovibrio sp.]